MLKSIFYSLGISSENYYRNIIWESGEK